MKIHVISAGSVFSTSASTNRMLSLAKGLVGSGHEVHIFCLAASLNNPTSGEIDGIKFWHASAGAPLKTRWRRGWEMCIQHPCELNKFLKNNSVNAALLMLAKPWMVFFTLQVLSKFSIPVFAERNEYPFILAPQIDTWLHRLAIRWWYIKKMVPRFSGLALMTKNIEAYFLQAVPRCPPTIVIPMTVEPERFKLTQESPFPFSYIGFCGVLTGVKDGVPILVESFGQISARFPELRLVIIGDDGDLKEIDALRVIARRYGAEDRLVFTGEISRKEMPRYLGNAVLLALSRPQSKQAEGGFPTKLGEYLATGRPTVVTRVGEISDYLEDGVHSFLAEPDDSCDFARALELALSDPAQATQVGANGRTLAYTVFDYRTQGRRLGDFIADTLTHSGIVVQ